MKAKDLTPEQKHLVITHDSWIEGPRWAFGPLWLDRYVMEFNDLVTEKGWKPLEIVSQKEDTSFLRKAISWTIRGEAYPLALFLEAMQETIRRY